MPVTQGTGEPRAWPRLSVETRMSSAPETPSTSQDDVWAEIITATSDFLSEVVSS